jgi:sugar/nucleoside kinase (ribokinase family)
MDNNISILFAGHFAVDTIIRFKEEFAPSIGGSVSYCSLALRKYTKNVDISIISNIGSLNFETSLLDSLKKTNIDLEGIKWSETSNTHFILDYFNHDRTLTLKSRSPNLNFKDIPKKFLDNHPDAVVLVPLCNEISIDYVRDILKFFPNTFIGIDLQGFIRSFDENGKLFLEENGLVLSNINEIIELIGDKLILKGSEEEMKMLSGEVDIYKVMEFFNDNRFKGISIMTLGERGSLITQHGKNLIIIPAFKPGNVADETGAGDVYLAIFLYELLISDKNWQAIGNAGYLASVAASFLVEKKGPNGFEVKEKILERLNKKEYIIDQEGK